MEGLTLSTKEQRWLRILNGVLERHWTMKEVAPLLGVSERQRWRLLAAYRTEGARGLAHKNRGRVPPNATTETIQLMPVTRLPARLWWSRHVNPTQTIRRVPGFIRIIYASFACGGIDSTLRLRPRYHIRPHRKGLRHQRVLDRAGKPTL